MDKGLRNTLIISGLVGGVSVGGYLLYRSILKAVKYEIIPQGVEIIDRQGQNLKLQINLAIKNPSDLKLSVSDKEFDIYLNGIYITRLKNPNKQVIYANSISSIVLTVDLNLSDVYKKLRVASGQTLSNTLNFLTDFNSQKLKLVTKISVQYGILPTIPIEIPYEDTISNWKRNVGV